MLPTRWPGRGAAPWTVRAERRDTTLRRVTPRAAPATRAGATPDRGKGFDGE